jgi:hypothetical protein
MRINISGKGIHRREVSGIEKLRALPPSWYAFTNLELIQPGSMPRQIDIVIVLDDRILIADLKDWNGKITSDGDHWLQNDRVVDTSPVNKILENTRIMAGLLAGYLSKDAARNKTRFNRWELPLIEGCVILTGRCDISKLPDLEKHRVFLVDEFCRFVQDSGERHRRLANPKWIDKAEPLTATNSKWHSRLAGFFGTGGYFRPLDRRFGDYRVISERTYEHPRQLYTEYDAEEVSASRGFGLLRLWDFSKADPRYASEEARAEIAGREHNVITYLVDRQPDLETVLIRPKIADPTIGVHYWEVYERRRQLRRLGDFLRTHSADLTPVTRVDLARTLLSHVAGMHRLSAAHLDLGEHSIWMELPSIIRLSHLVAASYPELATLGERRYEFLANETTLPEAVLGQALDHFRKDVFLLGTVIHEIIFGAAPKTRKAGDPPIWDSAVDPDGHFEYLHGWFDKSLDLACGQRFSNAQEMLDAFNNAIRKTSAGPNAIERLQRFRRWKSMLELYREFAVSEVRKETDRIIAWRSETATGNVLVKAWRRSCWGDEAVEAPRLARFCDAAEDLILAIPQGTARILDVGYLVDHLVLVQEFVNAPDLASHRKSNSATWRHGAVVIEFVRLLAKLVASLHDAGRNHGDLKPTNILVTGADGNPLLPLLVDLLDFGPAEEGEIRTPAYCPAYGVGTRERDRFAVLKIAEESLENSDLTAESAEFIKKAISTCREKAPALSTLDPLIEAIERIQSPPSATTGKRLVLRSPSFQPMRIASDEGRYYVCVHHWGDVTITGATEELVVIPHRYKKGEIFDIRRRPVQQSKVALAEKRAKTRLHDELFLEAGVRDFSPLKDLLKSMLKEEAPQPPVLLADADQQAFEIQAVADSSLDEDAIADSAVDVEPALTTAIDVPALWKTLLEVEEEQFTEGVTDLDSYYSRDKRRHFVPLQVTKGTIDFTREDKVMVEVPTKTRGWIQVGVLDLDLTRSGLVAVDASQYRARDGGMFCVAGTELRFKSVMETDSRLRRTAATSRLLQRKAVVPNLVDYFNPAASAECVEVVHDIDSDLVQNRYGLNQSQTQAFSKLWSKRPLGLLQGPPGTGKTKFIAALVHYALSKGSVRNVLLASQSHEAVNNATEGVLRLFRGEGKEPSLVRVGQEGNVSELLKPYHSAKVEEHYREQFRAGLKQRFHVAARHVGLPAGFTDELFFMEATLWPVLRQLLALLSTNDNTAELSETSRRISSLKQTLMNLEGSAGIATLGGRDWTDPNSYDQAIDALVDKHKVNSPEGVRKMRGIATLTRDWMGSVTSRRRSFEEFLAKTRQIVAGTCVGLGRSSLGLSSARFDLVIVDEAARCTPSELAVPLQAGRWILLVGDHFQLEPFHEPIVIRETCRRLKIPTPEVVRSDFERAFASTYGKQVGESLRTQYRMLPNIGRLISDVFYPGLQLEHGRSAAVVPAGVCPDFLSKELMWISTDLLGEHAFQTPGGGVGKSLANQVEANAIVDILRRLDDHQPFVEWLAHYEDDRKPIGIICTYAAQRELIRQKLRAVGLSGTMLNSCKIDTVDSYQGKENPIVILSLVRNNADGAMEMAQRTIAQGFMARANRINVALSRAMDKLVIVGTSQHWPSESPMARVASTFDKLCREGVAEFKPPAQVEEQESPKRKSKRKSAFKRNSRSKVVHE